MGPRARGTWRFALAGKTARASGAWRCRRVRGCSGDRGAGTSAALPATERTVRTALCLCSLDRRLGNCRGRPRRPSPRDHSLAPCITAAAACDVSLPSTFCVLWFSFGAADEKHRRRYANATLPGRSLIESFDPCETQAWSRRTPPFLIQDEPRVRELWLKLPAKPVCRDDT